jgi:hypothetical protein
VEYYTGRKKKSAAVLIFWNITKKDYRMRKEQRAENCV